MSVGGLVDPLYDEVAARIEKELFPQGRPEPPPLNGVDEAVTAMAELVRTKFNADIQKAQWTFFDKSSEAVPPPCSECGPKPASPLQTNWWREVRAWDVNQKKRERELELDDNMDGCVANAFSDALHDHKQTLRAVLDEAWSAKHPKIAGDWDEDGHVFHVTFK